ERLAAAVRAADAFLFEFTPRPRGDTDRLVANVRQAHAALKRHVRHADEFAERVEIWAAVLRTHAAATHAPGPASTERLKRAIHEAEVVFNLSKTPEEFAQGKERTLGELVRAARDLKNALGGGGAHGQVYLKQAARLARHLEARVV